MECVTDENVENVFADFPPDVSKRLLEIRGLIRQVADEMQVATLQECLRWGEPSFIATKGSAIRLGWKPDSAEKYCVLFNCQTSLISTFRELYGEEMNFDGNRAIVFSVRQKIPTEILKHCLSLALTYKQRKHLPLLGA